MLQIVQIFSVRPPLGGVTGRFALDAIPDDWGVTRFDRSKFDARAESVREHALF